MYISGQAGIHKVYPFTESLKNCQACHFIYTLYINSCTRHHYWWLNNIHFIICIFENSLQPLFPADSVVEGHLL